MTWPTEVKPREGDSPGTHFNQYVIGDELPELRFSLTPEVMKTYAKAVDADQSGYDVHGERVVIPSVLALYLMAVLYRKYPPAQGGIMAGNTFRFYAPVPMNDVTHVVATGRIEETFEKRGRQYVRYSATFKSGDRLIAEAENTSTFPTTDPEGENR